jgi:hypothetical protein
LRVTFQLSQLDGYFIIQKYNELNHRERAQTLELNHVSVHIKRGDFYSVSRPSYFIGHAAVTNNLNTMSKTRQNVLGH